MAVHLLTGATGLVGGRLLRDLLAGGHTVLAVVRDVADGPAIAALGAEVVVGDLAAPGAWTARIADADVVWHAGLPRFAPPVRGPAVRRAARRAAAAARAIAGAAGDRPVVLASSALVHGDRPGEDVAEDDPPRPAALAGPAAAAEAALAGTPGLRIVRLGWVYGPTGMLPAVVGGLMTSRYRIIGDGANPMPLIAAEDAASAMLAALSLPPGTYAAAEADVPTQRELVHAICAQTGALRPDSIPPRLASLSFGGPLAAAMRASVRLRPGGLARAGWHPARDWRRDLVSSVRPPAGSAPA
ncbi:MAG: NAD(P)H-binding protein [Thermoleophilia bacterium]|nr:NAD(P)H-binding protein [Thermoleophilia bacterium]